MKLINESLFNQIISESSFQNVSESLVSNYTFSSDFKKYLVLAQYPLKFKNIEPLQLYYNKYYYYLKFLVEHQKLMGFDAGLEQQEFKILEEGEAHPEIDWNVIENISITLKGE